MEELQPERDLSRSPLFEVMLVLQNVPLESLELSGLKLSDVSTEIRTAKFDLTLSMVEGSGGLAGTLEYNRPLE